MQKAWLFLLQFWTLGCLAIALAIATTPVRADNTVSYTYDTVGRIKTIQRADGVSISYQYDLNGNRTQQVISVGSPATGVSPQTGWWWNPCDPGSGFAIEFNSSGRAYLGAFIYDTSGNPVWYTALGSYDLNTFSGELVKYSTSPSASEDIGALSVLFSDPTDGALTWPAGQTPNWSITRYPIITNGVTTGSPAGAPQKGWWWNPSQGGIGYFLEVQGTTTAATMFFAAYTYNASGAPVWYVANATMPSVATQAFSATLYQYQGGNAIGGSCQTSPSSQSVGTVTFQFSNATSGTLTMPGGSPISIQRYTF